MNPIMYAIVGTIAVIGLLMVLFLGGGTTTTPSISPERANTLASSILSDFSQTRDAVNAMQVSGIWANDVVYNGTPSYGTTNPAAVDDTTPATAAYQVFSPQFGRMSAKTPTNDIFDSTITAANRIYIFRRGVVVGTTGSVNVGTATADVVMMAVGIITPVCQHINRVVGNDPVTATPVASGLAAATITAGNTPAIGVDGTSVGSITVPSSNGSPRSTGCITATTGVNIAYQVIVAN